MPKHLHLTGQTFGRLTATVCVGTSPRRHRMWRCVCICGNEVITSGPDLVRGSVKSCGCLTVEQLGTARHKHGHAGRGKTSVEYGCYRNMISRCYNKNNKQYNDYGGRGILVCERWLRGTTDASGFECFFADMGQRPSSKHSLDRSANDAGYSPDNCCWTTRRAQAFNTRRSVKLHVKDGVANLQEVIEDGLLTRSQVTYGRSKGLSHQQVLERAQNGELGRKRRYITFKGVTKTLKEWSSETGISAALINKRLGAMGWSVEKALTTPVQEHKRTRARSL